MTPLRPLALATLALATLGLLAGAACRDTASRVPTPLVVADTAPAAGAGASTPYLAAAADGSLWMSWMEPGADSVWSLRLAHRPVRGDWAAPVTIIRDSLLFANWADFPSVIADVRGRLVAHFLRRSSPGKYSYDAWVTTSADDGATWSAPQRLHSDTSATEHGFAALVPQADGSTLAAWLDGHATDGEHGEMSLGVGGVDSTLRVRPDTMVDLRTCECCQVAGARTPTGAIVAYRDRSPDEIRDIAVVRLEHGRWTAPAIVYADRWVTRACPVNGPAISARGQEVTLAWFSNARDTAKVQVAFSADAGVTWSAPLRIDDGQPVGRVDVEALPAGGALVTWLERTGAQEAEIRTRRVGSGGMSAAAVIARTADARTAGFPRAVATERGVFVTWRELTTPSRIRMAIIQAPAIR